MNPFLEFFAKLPFLFREVGIAGLVDMGIVTLVIYTFMVVVKRTQRSGLIFTGILITGAVYLAARKPSHSVCPCCSGPFWSIAPRPSNAVSRCPSASTCCPRLWP